MDLFESTSCVKVYTMRLASEEGDREKNMPGSWRVSQSKSTILAQSSALSMSATKVGGVGGTEGLGWTFLLDFCRLFFAPGPGIVVQVVRARGNAAKGWLRGGVRCIPQSLDRDHIVTDAALVTIEPSVLVAIMSFDTTALQLGGRGEYPGRAGCLRFHNNVDPIKSDPHHTNVGPAVGSVHLRPPTVTAFCFTCVE